MWLISRRLNVVSRKTVVSYLWRVYMLFECSIVLETDRVKLWIFFVSKWSCKIIQNFVVRETENSPHRAAECAVQPPPWWVNNSFPNSELCFTFLGGLYNPFVPIMVLKTYAWLANAWNIKYFQGSIISLQSLTIFWSCEHGENVFLL